MNRWLTIPAGCCLLVFAGLLAALHAARGRESAAAHEYPSAAPHLYRYRPAPAVAAGDRMLSREEGRRALVALTGEYLRPWRRWETSPHRMLSRAAPRRIPSISAEVELADSGQGDALLLAAIVVNQGEHRQSVPCVVDRTTRQVRLFDGGQWLSQDEWVKRAPTP